VELALVLLALAIVVAAVLLTRRPPADPAALRTLETVSRSLGQIQSELARTVRSQEDLKRDVQSSREASLQQLHEATLGLKSEIGAAQKALAEVKALDQGRASQMELASASLKRLEAVVAGSSSRGAAGENILAKALTQLPADLLEINVAFGSKIVEYALRLPGGRLLPIDSKWPAVPALERLGETIDGPERRRLQELVANDLRKRAKELAKYLDPERTLSLAVLAVPDAAYTAAPEIHAEAYRGGVLVVPYSLALPYVLALYRLSLRFGVSVDADQMTARLRALDGSLRLIGDEVEGRLSRGLVQIQNARDAVRGHVVDAQNTATRLLRSTEGEGDLERDRLLASSRIAETVGDRD
jgi:DNA recombination protein RmuC